ncbi:histone methyltransferase set2 [Phlyctochytrium bullatum]|nr:histone methyltransferase set2 [Phlyctochytrium bullatum]
MGVFTLRDIEEDEELTFDYKFERYGAEPQPCYCGEIACKGVIGGEKQSDLRGLEDEEEDVGDALESPVSDKSKRADEVDAVNVSPNRSLKDDLQSDKKRKAEEEANGKTKRQRDYEEVPINDSDLSLASFDASGKSHEAAVFLPRIMPKKAEEAIKPRITRSPSTASASSPRLVDTPVDRPLPKSWKAAQAADGKTYYYNIITRETQWDFPEKDRNTSDNIKSLSSIVEGVSEADIEAIVREATSGTVNGLNSAGASAVPDELKALRPGISEVVVKVLSRYKSQIEAEKFKKLARKITHLILEKEAKKPSPRPTAVSDDMKAKIKKFVKNFLERAGIIIVEEKKEKKASNGHHKHKKSKR